ncbi:hypothetical protein BDV23DRAFT_191385 [Aspergillus alliaceus]|uniref:NADAR domain-containing protein n=1 Tax=Petromyces alliaceus TaxID=209559 RepID=A0A5N7BS53_PETAA|nr:hypothetical protein BDV23DRAFT_191385 [Aspergillus alliaceus]
MPKPNKITKPKPKSKSKRQQRSKSDSNPETNALKRNPTIHTTPTHIIFVRGPLSNWHPSPPFRGQRALDLCLPKLDELGIEYPARNAAVTRLIGSWDFTCGEQWMMGMKAWLFEGLPFFDSVKGISEEEFTELRRVVGPSKAPRGEKEKAILESSVTKVLRAREPRVQKAIGRRVDGFREEVWSVASEAVVTAGCIARAEVDGSLRALYLASEGRGFVEGSVRDCVWGVGLKWDGVEIEDERNWRGENRLGRCHDEAARVVRGGLV